MRKLLDVFLVLVALEVGFFLFKLGAQWFSG